MDRAIELARRIDEAGRTVTPMAPPSDQEQLPIEVAYEVQNQCTGLRILHGDTPTGYKLAFTVNGNGDGPGVPAMASGRLFQSMHIAEGGSIDAARFLRPRVNPSIAYLLKRPLSGNAKPAEVLKALEAVAPALEITDCRYTRADVAPADFVADNAFASAFALGRYFKADVDAANLGILLDVNGRNVRVASTAALLGNPLRAFVALAEMLAKSAQGLARGDIVLAGNATGPHAVAIGDHIRSTTQNLGTVALHVR